MFNIVVKMYNTFYRLIVTSYYVLT